MSVPPGGSGSSMIKLVRIGSGGHRRGVDRVLKSVTVQVERQHEGMQLAVVTVAILIRPIGKELRLEVRGRERVAVEQSVDPCDEQRIRRRRRATSNCPFV